MILKFSIDGAFSAFYRENGFVVLTDLVSKGSLDRAREELFDLFETRLAEWNGEGLQGSDLIKKYYNGQSEAWRQAAHRMCDLLAVYRLAAGKSVQDILWKLGLRKPMISTRPEIRTDMPRDDLYRQPWHQDWRSGQGSLNSLTIWTPLHDVRRIHGAIEVIAQSHLLGYVPAIEIQNPRRFVIESHHYDESLANVVELDYGESVVFSQMLIHRSGFNESDRPRLSVQMRFTDYREPRFVEEGMPTPIGSDLVWSRPPSPDQMAEVFRGIAT